MVNRGRAVVVKKDKYKDIWVDSGGNEVSPPSSPDLEKANRPKPKQPQKLSSEAPWDSRQGSQSFEQSAASRGALAHLFDDDNNNARDYDAPVPSVETRTALPLSDHLESVSLAHDQSQAYKGTSPETNRKSTTPAAELARPDSVLERNFRTEQPTLTSRGALYYSASNAPCKLPIEQPAETEEMANTNNFIPTNQHRNMRACMVCSIVKTEQQFKNFGCPNCDGFLQLRGNQDGIQDCTSQVFEGLITISDTRKSWVARWQRLEGYVPGVYAVQVEGILPEEFIAAAEENGVHYIPRDGSVNEALPTDA